jgi:hypothetical protein
MENRFPLVIWREDALLPEGMLFPIMPAPDKSMRRKSCRWLHGARGLRRVDRQ